MKHIAIHSVPRSGSTWLGCIFDSAPNLCYRFQPLWSYAFKGSLNVNSSKEDVFNFFDAIAASDDAFITQKDEKSRNLIPSFEKLGTEAIAYKEVRYHYLLRHMLSLDENLTVIGLVRNPLSVISSWFLAPKEFKKELGWQLEEEWENAPSKNNGRPEEYNGFTKWIEVTNLFHDLEQSFPQNFKIVRYDDLLNDTENTVRNLFSFCKLELTEQTLRYIRCEESQSSNDAYSVFRRHQTDDKWKQIIPKEIIDKIHLRLKEFNLESYLPDEIR